MHGWIERAGLPWALELPDAEGFDADTIADALARARAGLAAIDAGAVANVSEGRRVGHTWLRTPDLAPEAADAAAIRAAVVGVEALAADVLAGRVASAAGPFRRVIHVGMGGSALGPRFLVAAAGRGGLPVDVLDSVDPDALAGLLARVGADLDRALVLVVSKSGGTVETMGALDVILAALRARGVDPARHLVAITLDGSPLARRAHDEGWVATLPMWPWVGGRFAATSAVGLLPLALAGGSVREALEGAGAMDAWCRGSAEEDPGARLGLTWWLHAQRGRRHLAVIPYADRLVVFGQMVQQLVMESLGKPVVDAPERREGLVVFGHRGSGDQHAVLQHLQEGPDETVTFLFDVLRAESEGGLPLGPATGDLQQALLLGTRRALRASGRPVGLVVVDRIDAYVAGGLVALIERAVGAYAELARVHGYDQPGVEAGKRASNALLRAAAGLLARLDATPRSAVELAQGLDLDEGEAELVLRRLDRTGRARRLGAGWVAGPGKPAGAGRAG